MLGKSSWSVYHLVASTQYKSYPTATLVFTASQDVLRKEKTLLLILVMVSYLFLNCVGFLLCKFLFVCYKGPVVPVIGLPSSHLYYPGNGRDISLYGTKTHVQKAMVIFNLQY